MAAIDGLSSLVDLENGTISREVFVNEEIYRQEQEQIFARAWLFIGHESQIPNRGDFFISRMGEESVILTRDRRNKIHVFLNTCRHRGMKVCRYDAGNTQTFSCPYHGWTYDIDGRLVGVPNVQEAYDDRFDRSQWGLIEVPQMENYKGSIWATWDKGAPPFLDYIGDYKVYLDTLFDGYDGREGGAEVLDGVHIWRMPCNWKFPATTFGGDAAHAISHRSTLVAAYGPQGEGDRHGARQDAPQTRYEIGMPDLGHGCHIHMHSKDEPYTPTWQTMPNVEDYFRSAWESRQAKMIGNLYFEVGAATVFPNASWASGIRRTMAVWHPHGPQMTEAWRFYLVDKTTPPEARDALRRYHMRYSGPAGMTEQDDMENWNYASAASKGTIARRYPYNYQMRLGVEPVPDVPLPGFVSPILAEQNQRYRFKRWLEFMESPSWDEIYPKAVTAVGRQNGR
ncbi:MAG: hcaE [Chloroflexi bacterium]|nr:hcaE [Chloroflexota bacterium]